MKTIKNILLLSLITSYLLINSAYSKAFDWAVIGAGPAGITTIGVLIDNGVNPKNILWIDRGEIKKGFHVGRLGERYDEVPSNTQPRLFLDFFDSCKAFPCKLGNSIMPLQCSAPLRWCPLLYVIDPLQVVTDCLRNQVVAIEGTVTKLDRKSQESWSITIDDKTVHQATRTVLAIGSQPKRLNSKTIQEIDIDLVMKPTLLKHCVTKDDVIAIFGNGSSGVLAVRNLNDFGVKKIINFYKTPLRYFEIKRGKAINENTGLVSFTKEWAKNILEKKKPSHIIQVQNTKENLQKYLPECTKIISAVGFKRNAFCYLDKHPELSYNDQNGIIAPQLFGIGIAFPKWDRSGDEPVRRVGINHFMRYAKQIIPLWMKS